MEVGNHKSIILQWIQSVTSSHSIAQDDSGPIRDTLRAFIEEFDALSGEETKSDETWRKNFGFEGDVDLAA